MASLRDIAGSNADMLREGVGWVIVYRSARAWESLAIWSDVWNDGFETEDLNNVLEIVRVDPRAVILNGYFCGLRDLAVDELAGHIRWRYERGYNRLADRGDIQRAQEAIEEARKMAEEVDLPFCERFYEGPNDDFDPYAYGADMTPEDYAAMWAAREAACGGGRRR